MKTKGRPVNKSKKSNTETFENSRTTESSTTHQNLSPNGAQPMAQQTAPVQRLIAWASVS